MNQGAADHFAIANLLRKRGELMDAKNLADYGLTADGEIMKPWDYQEVVGLAFH
jgi:hypothetical protein